MKSLAVILSILFSPMLFGQAPKGELKISPLGGDFYVYTTYKLLNGNPFPSNSLYLVTTEGVVMIDTPWDTTQFQPLLDSIWHRHHKSVLLCISTHFHDDRTAGLDFLKQRGIATYSSKRTYDLCAVKNERQPESYFLKDTVFTIGNHSFQTYYPGEGHTADNIVVWFGREKILYGACLVKSTENTGLGNVADANIEEWSASIRNVMRRFPGSRFVIPGHFSWKSKNSLRHTLKLLSEYGRR